MRAYFVKPDGTHFIQLSMGGALPIYRQPVWHPEIKTLEDLNPEATHLEFARTALYATLLGRPHAHRDEHIDYIVGLRLWVYVRAVRQCGPLIDNTWEEVPWQRVTV